MTIDAYAEIDDIRDEDLDTDELSDARAEILLEGWSKWFDLRTGQWFKSKNLTLLLDGSGTKLMQLQVPIIDITALYINDDFDNALDSSLYIVYNRTYPDDRKNPRIKLVRSSSSSSIFSGVNSSSIFVAGYQNQKVVGSFGYVEADGSTPFAVKRAIIMLTIITAALLSDGDIDLLKAGRAIEEVTDRHRIKYSDVWDQINAFRPTGFEEIDNALAMYRRPIKITRPRMFTS